MVRRYPFRRYVYYGVPPQDEQVLYYEYSTKPKDKIVYRTDDPYAFFPYLVTNEYQPKPNYELDDQIINQIAYRIMTTITQYKPKREVEIAPTTRFRVNLG